ncbi:hypothetical protein QFC20_006153 [Naganishia adeliensis]|uniref:Uncharacterized protein n=1 Tax=Naganishia adeliensis TaxID=92952 RepID=A0ACC2VG91_9TREE|nr:hypothetical protein QFC20_006153 [Naganishia adeliensis]
MAASADEIPPVVSEQVVALEDFAGEKRQRFLNIGNIGNVEDRLDEEIQEHAFIIPKDLWSHRRSLFHSPRYRLLRYLTEEFPEKTRFPKAFVVPSLPRPQEKMTKFLRCPFCRINGGKPFRSDSYFANLEEGPSIVRLLGNLQIMTDKANAELWKPRDPSDLHDQDLEEDFSEVSSICSLGFSEGLDWTTGSETGEQQEI